MNYYSSRGQSPAVTAAQAIKTGIAPDGGLFVPESIPLLEEDIFERMKTWSYQERAIYILEKYLTDFSKEEIEDCVNKAYNEAAFDNRHIAPLFSLANTLYILELWHGPTAAFKDMALQILPELLTTSARKTGDGREYVILVATSGDTGKAALEGFRDVAGTRIIVFFPLDGVSEVQKRQMLTQEGGNVHVAAVKGNFDDAQNGVKRIFASEDMKRILDLQAMTMSSANSINWGRLLPQIVYYVSAYADLMAEGKIKAGEEINIVVPTGNFGNILAAFYAGRMGVPVHKLICASNANNVLTEFIHNGLYDRNRPFEKTISPSMDILISSNLERLLFELNGHNSGQVAAWMEELKQRGSYSVDENTRSEVQRQFWADYGSDEETLATIKSVWNREDYLLDTHTAVAFWVYEKYRAATGDERVTVIASTASPYKFGSSVAQAVLDEDAVRGQNEFELLRMLAQATGVAVPEAISGLEQKPVLHGTVCSVQDMEQTLIDFLRGR